MSAVAPSNVTVTATISTSSSGAATPVSGASQSFLQNKPLSNGVFAAVGIIGAIILALICVVWVRSTRRRTLDREALNFDPGSHMRFTDEEDEKNSTEAFNLRRAASTRSASSTGHTQNTNHTIGGYPIPPMPVRTGDYPFNGYGTALSQQGNYPGGQQGYDQQQQNGNIAHTMSRSPPQVVYAPPRSPQPGYNPSTPVYSMDQQPVMPASAVVASQPMRRSSLINSPPGSPTNSQHNVGRRLSSHSRMLDPAITHMPISPPLPDHFGSDEDASVPHLGMKIASPYEPTPLSFKVSFNPRLWRDNANHPITIQIANE